MFWGKKKDKDEVSEEVDVKDRRHYFRLEKQISVKLFDTQKHQFVFTTKDFSGGGARVTGHGGFPPGTYLTIHIQLESSMKPIVAMSKVVWVKRAEEPRNYDIGLEFVDIKETDRDFIVKYINDELLRLRRKGAI